MRKAKAGSHKQNGQVQDERQDEGSLELRKEPRLVFEIEPKKRLNLRLSRHTCNDSALALSRLRRNCRRHPFRAGGVRDHPDFFDACLFHAIHHLYDDPVGYVAIGAQV